MSIIYELSTLHFATQFLSIVYAKKKMHAGPLSTGIATQDRNVDNYGATVHALCTCCHFT